MNSTIRWAVAVILLFGAFLVTGLGSFKSGYNSGITEGKAMEHLWAEQEVARIKEMWSPIIYDNNDNDTDMEIIQQLLQDVTTANITLSYYSVYGEGVISIYFDKK